MALGPKDPGPKSLVPVPAHAWCPAGQGPWGPVSPEQTQPCCQPYPGVMVTSRDIGWGLPVTISFVLIGANPLSVQQNAVVSLWDRNKPQLPGRPRLLQPAVQPGYLLAQRDRLLQSGQQDSGVR